MSNAPTNLPATEYLSGRPDVATLAGAAISTAVAGPIAMKPNSMGELMEFAKLMAMSRGSIPACLRNNPADCLAVAMDAYSAGLSPFALAKDAYKVGDIIAYGAKSTIAMLYALAPLNGRLHLEWTGEGERLVCTVTGKLRGDDRPKVLEVELRTITVRNSPMWKQQPKVQLGYWAQRAWARLYCPEATLGAPCIEDVEAEQKMRDVTPPGEKPRTAAAQLSSFASAPIEQHEDYIPPEPTHPLVDTEGEVIFETTSSQQWMAKFEEALKITSDPAALWKLNDTALEWAADMLDGGDETMLRLRKTYLEKPAETVDWTAKVAELREGANACADVQAFVAFKKANATTIKAMPDDVFADWSDFAEARATELKGSK